PELRQLRLLAPERLLERGDPFRRCTLRRAEGALDTRESLVAALQVAERALAGQRFDPAHARGDAAFGTDQERSDLAGVPHVAAAAELERTFRKIRKTAGDRDRPDP